MRLKKFNYKKELKKIQGKGIHSKKFKYYSILGVAILSIFIYTSFAMYLFSSDRYSAFKTTTSKKIKINTKANGGYVEGSLVEKILTTHQVTKPTTTPGQSVSASDEAVLASAEDDYGTSYYFRGAITDNYVSLAGFTWRVVRINGDGSVRLILDGALNRTYYNGSLKTDIASKPRFNETYNANKYVGYTYSDSSNDVNETVNKSSTDSTVKQTIDKFYEDYLTGYEDIMADSIYCNDRSLYNGDGIGTNYTNYGAYGRRINNQVSLKCEQKNDRYTVNDTTIGNGGLKYPIGLLTYDELVYAGAYYQNGNKSYYLYNSLSDAIGGWYTMTPQSFENSSSGNSVIMNYSEPGWSVAGATVVFGGGAIRPVINLRADAIVESGNGTSESKAYKIKTNEKTTDYKTTTTMKVYPNSGYVYDTSKGVTCTNGQSGSYNEANNTLTITSPSKDTECTVNFKELPKLKDKVIADAQRTNTYKVGKTPNFTQGEPLSDGTSTSTGSGLFSAIDDKGTSYYFRGNVNNNYVKFAGQDWQIVRINGDETIRLISKTPVRPSVFNLSNNSRKYVGYTYDNTPCTTNDPCESTYSASDNTFSNTHNGKDSRIKISLEDWYRTTLKDFDDNIAYGTYCNDTSYARGSENGTNDMYYGAYERVHNSGSNYGYPTLVCPDSTVGPDYLEEDTTVVKETRYHTYGGVYKLKIGLLNELCWIVLGRRWI